MSSGHLHSDIHAGGLVQARRQVLGLVTCSLRMRRSRSTPCCTGHTRPHQSFAGTVRVVFGHPGLRYSAATGLYRREWPRWQRIVHNGARYRYRSHLHSQVGCTECTLTLQMHSLLFCIIICSDVYCRCKPVLTKPLIFTLSHCLPPGIFFFPVPKPWVTIRKKLFTVRSC